MNIRLYRLSGLALLLLAAAFTALKVPVASSQGITLEAAAVAGDLPVSDPDSAIWRQATALEVPLSAQNVIKPLLSNPSVRSVVARALFNDSQLAILVEWDDATMDDQMVRIEDFRDAVAVQFPLAEGQPFFCMGQQGGDVNIWHWKADWQADMVTRRDMESVYPNMYVDYYQFTDSSTGIDVGPEGYTDSNYLPALAAGNLFASATHVSPVEDVIAGGFGSLTAQSAEDQNVQGHGVWDEGSWRVIFSRDLVSDGQNDVIFDAGNVHIMAFAAWDGANGERNGQKSTSQWVSLQFGGEAPVLVSEAGEVAEAPAQGLPGFVIPVAIIVVGGGLFVAVGVFVASRSREPKEDMDE